MQSLFQRDAPWTWSWVIFDVELNKRKVRRQLLFWNMLITGTQTSVTNFCDSEVLIISIKLQSFNNFKTTSLNYVIN